jgi:cell division protein FtsN
VPPPAAPPAPATDSPPPFAAATALPPPAAADSLAARFSVQVGAYALLDNAEQRVAELSERGYSPYIVEIGGAGGRRLYTVRIGRFTSDAEARREAARFAAEGDGEAVVRRLATAS